MQWPKPRNIVAAFLIVGGMIAVGLAIAQDQETLQVSTPIAAEDPRFPPYLTRLLGHELTTGDDVAVHTNGSAAFPAMLAAIGRAKFRISFETYIFEAGAIAEQFTNALEAAASRGVDVRLVLDSIGARPMDKSHRERLEAAGCLIGWFNPVASYSLEEANYRTHRKALVIDGETAFVGGIGIADHWAHASGGHPPWRDTHLELHGPVALDVEAAFNENWIETGGVVEPDVLPHDRPAGGPARSTAVWSSPEGGANAIKLLYLLALGAARRTLDIQSPYFITDESTDWSLREARRRGVRIRVLVEGDVTDAKPVKFASRAAYERLLAEGIEIFEYQPTMMHTKALIVDGVLSIAGSANFDNRSFELNDELNVAVFDRALAARLRTDFERDITQSKKLELREWRSRPVLIRAREQVWSYFGEIF
jgi:cardiolipin synthase